MVGQGIIGQQDVLAGREESANLHRWSGNLNHEAVGDGEHVSQTISLKFVQATDLISRETRLPL